MQSIGHILRRWSRRPESFYIILCLAFVGVQFANLISYLHSSNLVAMILPNSAQLLSLTAGTFLVFRAFQVLASFAWAYITPRSVPPAPYAGHEAHLPVVTVQIPLRNEELEIVARHSIQSAFALDYPPNRLDIQVIDNSDSPEQYLPIKHFLEAEAVRQAARGVSTVFIHRDGTEGFKAGNLNRGLAVARGSFFLILDADSTVPSDTLLAILPYFEDPKVGYVQLEVQPLNEYANVITRGGAMLARSRIHQVRVKAAHGFVGFDGHNGILRREALEAINGWSEELSEDIATSIRMRMAGFCGRYVWFPTGELLAERLPDLLKQRWRWTLGTTQLLWSVTGTILVSKQLRWFEKLDIITFLASLPTEALAYGLIFTFVPVPPTTVLLMLALWFIPSLLVEKFVFRRALARHVSVVFIFAAVMPIYLRAALLSFSKRPHRFEVTAKGVAKPLPLGRLLRVHAFGLACSIVFFAVVVLWMGHPDYLLKYYLGGTIIMGSGLVAPFALNYSNWLVGVKRELRRVVRLPART